jgi:hypothetical protein
VADVLVDHPDGLPVTEIAMKTGIEQGKLARILRFLASKHCFREGRCPRNACISADCVIYR